MEPSTDLHTVADYLEFSERLKNLSCQVPNEGFAILPMYLDSAISVDGLKNASTTSTIKKLFRQKNIQFEDVTGTTARAVPLLFESLLLPNQSGL